MSGLIAEAVSIPKVAWRIDILGKSNDCHNPAGDATGGEFCSGGAGDSVAPTVLPDGMVSNAGGKESYLKRVQAAMQKLPQTMIDKLRHDNVKVEVVDRIGQNTVGLYRDTDDTIFVASQFRGPNGLLPNRLPDETVVHEIGHALDRHTSGFLRSGMLTDTFKAEYDKLNAADRYLMSHFILNGKESLARTFTHLYADKGSGLSKVQFGKRFPKSIAILTARLREAGYT